MSSMNTTPFVSTSFSPENESMRTMPAPISPRPMAMQSASPPAQTNELDNLYPEIYREIYPLVADAVDKMIAGGYNPTPDAVSAIVDNIIKNSGLWYEDEDDSRFDADAEVVPAQFGFGRMPFRRRRRRHHNRDTLRDIIRILLLRELFGRRRGFPRGNY